ncbi:Fe(3+)-siderophore ABC transporter permease, partial [Vibrio cholerae O1 biovar El Tor]|nr:Fe(3+)-siderophore ABC transporter permease [Vibrio cholerae O1 biovar El Tor]
METITSVAPEGRSNQTRFWLWRKGAYTLRVERRNIAVALVLSLIVLALM